MSGIDIDLGLISETEKEINIIKSDYFSQAKNVVSQNINRLDVNVLNKNSIEYRLRKVVERLTGLENTMQKLGLYIISVENNISEAEGNVKKILKEHLSDVPLATGIGTGGVVSKNELAFSKSPFSFISGTLKNGVGFLNDKWLNAVNAYGDLNDITQILGITEEDGPLDILVKKIGISKPLQKTIKYINSTVECIDALEQGNYEKAAETGIDMAEDVLIAATAGSVPGAGLVKDLGKNMVNNFADNYGEYWNNPNIKNLGKLIYSSTFKAAFDVGFDTGFDIIDKIPGGKVVTDYYRENTNGKTGAAAYYDIGRQTVDEVKEVVKKSGGFGNFYMEGVELMVDGFKSIFQK